MNRDHIEACKRLFRKFDTYPSTRDNDAYKAFLGGVDGKEYWTAYNEHYGTDYTTNVETIRL